MTEPITEEPVTAKDTNASEEAAVINDTDGAAGMAEDATFDAGEKETLAEGAMPVPVKLPYLQLKRIAEADSVKNSPYYVANAYFGKPHMPVAPRSPKRNSPKKSARKNGKAPPKSPRKKAIVEEQQQQLAFGAEDTFHGERKNDVGDGEGDGMETAEDPFASPPQGKKGGKKKKAKSVGGIEKRFREAALLYNQPPWIDPKKQHQSSPRSPRTQLRQKKGGEVAPEAGQVNGVEKDEQLNEVPSNSPNHLEVTEVDRTAAEVKSTDQTDQPTEEEEPIAEEMEIEPEIAQVDPIESSAAEALESGEVKDDAGAPADENVNANGDEGEGESEKKEGNEKEPLTNTAAPESKIPPSRRPLDRTSSTRVVDKGASPAKPALNRAATTRKFS